MKKMSALSVLSAALVVFSAPSVALAQVTIADYQRAQSLRQAYEAASIFVPDTPTWIGATHRFYYRRSLANGHEFVMVDADTQQKQPAFDHNRLADSLSKASARTYSPTRLGWVSISTKSWPQSFRRKTRSRNGRKRDCPTVRQVYLKLRAS